MIKIKWFKGLLVQKIPLMIIAVTLALGLSLVQQSLTLPFLLIDSSPNTSALTFFESALQITAKKLLLHYIIQVSVSYVRRWKSDKRICKLQSKWQFNLRSKNKRGYEVYAPNGTLIRTSSYPDGFIAQDSGGVEGLETTIKDSTLQSITANVTFRDLNKTDSAIKRSESKFGQHQTRSNIGDCGEGAAEAGP